MGAAAGLTRATVHHRCSGRPLPAAKAAKAAVASQKEADPTQLSRWSIFIAERSAAVPACHNRCNPRQYRLSAYSPLQHSTYTPYLCLFPISYQQQFCHPRQAASAGGSRSTCWTPGGSDSIARCAHCHLSRRLRPYGLRRFEP